MRRLSHGGWRVLYLATRASTVGTHEALQRYLFPDLVRMPAILREREREREREGGAMREAVVLCGERMSAGITIQDAETWDDLLRIPTCASSPHGLLCIRNHLLVASQLQKHRPFGGGAIFFWALNKPQQPFRSYTLEAIEPVACSKDGVYLVGGAPSGNAYIWEVPSGRLLKSWRAHCRAVKNLAFSQDDSFLISGSEDGIICVWVMISLLNVEDPQACGSLRSFHTWSEHTSSISGLLPISGVSCPRVISSSLDGTCKVRDLVSGKLQQTHVFSVAVTTVAVDPGEQLVLAGCENGRICINVLGVGMEENPIMVPEDQSQLLCGHKGPITALTFSPGGLWFISASKDCTACLWDARTRQAIRRFNNGNGYITNLLVIPHSSLFVMENQRTCLRTRVSLLDKTPHMDVPGGGTRTYLPHYYAQEGHLATTDFRTTNLLSKQIIDLEQGRTPEAIQMLIETSVENRLRAITMTKHLTAINKHLQSLLLDMMQQRLCHDHEIAQVSGRKPKASDHDECNKPLP